MKKPPHGGFFNTIYFDMSLIYKNCKMLLLIFKELRVF